jgi:site-specific recombinase XerD
MSYEDYELESKQIQDENGKLLTGFAEWMLGSNLKEKTIRKHVQNVDFYVNVYLLYDDCTRAMDGISSLNGFFNWFFPRKAMWSSTASTKETVASLKKFYKYLAEKNIVEISDYKYLLAMIKQGMSEWLEHYKDEYEW